LAGCGTKSSTHNSSQTSLSSIAITPATSSIANGLTLQLTATGTYTGGTTQNITTSSSWSPVGVRAIRTSSQ
jgi:hypothetical protein